MNVAAVESPLPTTMLLHDRAALFAGDGLITTECLLGPKSVDLVLTDPPYSEHTHANLGREQRNDGVKSRDALEFAHLTEAEIRQHAARYVHLCRGWIIVFTDDRSVDAWGRALELAGGRWVRTGHWVKTNPMPQMTGDRPAVGTEPIVIAHSNPEPPEEDYPYLESTPIVIGHAFPPGKGKMKWQGGGRAALWRGPGCPHNERVHPNQKPLWLLQELAALFAPPGAVVLDPFAGSASTGVAVLGRERFPGSKSTKPPALPDGFSFIGIERSPSYVPLALERLQTALKGITP